jgi:hypothetical protein
MDWVPKWNPTNQRVDAWNGLWRFLEAPSSTSFEKQFNSYDMSLVTVYKMGPLPIFNLPVLSPGPSAIQYQPKDWYINILSPWFGQFQSIPLDSFMSTL